VKALLAAAAAVAALTLTATAAAHPLGNFTVNRFSLVQPSGNRVYVRYVLDLAEIPTFQARDALESEGRGAYAARSTRELASGLLLTVEGERVPLLPLRHALAFPPGQGGLNTTRLELLLATPPLTVGRLVRLHYQDTNYAGRIGWREIVLRAGAGAEVRASSVPARTVSDGLLSYPKDLLQSPLDVTEARAGLLLKGGPGAAPELPRPAALEQRARVRAVADGGFASLVARRNLSAAFVLVALAIAFFWGAAHALSPGHGKSIVAAYLVGSRGTPRHAVLLGLTVTVTHTIGVFALGLLTLGLSAFIVPEELYPWLNLASALLVVGVGVSILRWRLREWRASAHHHHHHGDGHHHDHHHPDPALGRRRLLGIGISGGIVPCPTALVVLLAAISLHRVGYGLVLILAFSLGLAAAMTGVGLLAVTAKRAFERVDFESRLVRLLPALSALVVLGLGLAMTARALPSLT
jgi:ABC-type nickel/cobalt efflux system permease component RcnA